MKNVIWVVLLLTLVVVAVPASLVHADGPPLPPGARVLPELGPVVPGQNPGVNGYKVFGPNAVRRVPIRLANPPQPEGFWITLTAYDLKIAFWTGVEPHYGAFFSGSYGYNQHYLGPGGDAATCGSSAGCISNWNWWDTYRDVLLVPKGGWLFTAPPWDPKWQGASYRATLWIN